MLHSLDTSLNAVTFAKYHANGNDFIVIDGQNSNVELSFLQSALEKVAQKLCDRRLGVGADGILLLKKLGENDLELMVINSDGSMAQNCGNGLRIAALWFQKSFGSTCVNIKLADRSYKATVEDEGKITVEMGLVSLKALLEQDWQYLGPKVQVFDAEIGNKHLIIIDANLRPQEAIKKIQSNYSNWALFNVNFVNSQTRSSVVYERGVGFTKSCGSGAMAAAVSLAYSQKINGSCSLTINQPGGSLEVFLNPQANSDSLFRFQVKQRGSAEYVFSGQIALA